MLNEQDRFIDYINHVENQKKQKYQADLQEIDLLNASGTALRNSTRYADLKFAVEDQESEIESRDFNAHCKTAVPVTIKHYEHGCIGTESCFKQKNIEKLFVANLNILQKANSKKPSDSQTFFTTMSALKNGQERIGSHLEEQTCKEFVNLID
jgi:hypothetical protein